MKNAVGGNQLEVLSAKGRLNPKDSHYGGLNRTKGKVIFGSMEK